MKLFVAVAQVDRALVLVDTGGGNFLHFFGLVASQETGVKSVVGLDAFDNFFGEGGLGGFFATDFTGFGDELEDANENITQSQAAGFVDGRSFGNIGTWVAFDRFEIRAKKILGGIIGVDCQLGNGLFGSFGFGARGGFVFDFNQSVNRSGIGDFQKLVNFGVALGVEGGNGTIETGKDGVGRFV